MIIPETSSPLINQNMSQQLLPIAILLAFLQSTPVLAGENHPENESAIDAVSETQNEVMAALQLAAEFEAEQDHDSALDEYLSLVQVVAQSEGDYSDQLLEPLAGLSRTYIALGYIEEAESSIRKAQHIAHRNDGVYSPRQIEFIEMMTDLALNTGEPLDADKQQQFLFFVSSHHFSGLESTHAYIKLAKWYNATGQYREARKVLEQSITMIQANAGEYDLRLLEPLKLISESRRLQGGCCIDRDLERAIEILNQHGEPPADMIADIHGELADAYIIYNKPEIAAEQYAASYAAMKTGESQAPRLISMSKRIGNNRHNQRQMFRLDQDSFGGQHRMRRMSLDEQLQAQYQPPQFYTVPLPENNYGLTIKDTLTMGMAADDADKSERLLGTPFQFISHQVQNIVPIDLRDEARLALISIDLNFSVSETGKAYNVEFTHSNAPVKLNRLMKDVMRKAKFRPGLVEGRPVITHNVTLSQSFGSQ
jgi:tetratricopeptide (TPR) repeat protein